MKKSHIIKVLVLLITIVAVSIVGVVLSLNSKKENKNNDTDKTDLIVVHENDLKTVALPTASPELLSQIEEAPKETVKPKVVDTVDPYFCTLEYQIKHTIGCRVDELEFTDIPVGKTFEYEGLKFTITDYSIITGKEFMDQFFDEEDKKIPESELADDNFSKDGTYAVVYYNFEKIEDEATYIELEMLFSDMKVCGVFDRNLTNMVKEYLGNTEKRRLMDIPIGEKIDTVGILNLQNSSDSDEFFILIPKVSGEVEKKLMVDGKMTEDEALAKYNENKTRFYRIKLVKE